MKYKYPIPLGVDGEKYKPITAHDLIGAVNHYFEIGESALVEFLGGEVPQNPKGIAETWKKCLREWVTSEADCPTGL